MSRKCFRNTHCEPMGKRKFTAMNAIEATVEESFQPHTRQEGCASSCMCQSMIIKLFFYHISIKDGLLYALPINCIILLAISCTVYLLNPPLLHSCPCDTDLPRKLASTPSDSSTQQTLSLSNLPKQPAPTPSDSLA
ncbi:hypothetical protein PoB_000075400 [Plakobranchus ocellatus]|uniref:Uncharacterized protein n=1 Tax=Plakobranchus ocellatus TaxID=259542 RepID=A0AAV3XT93_9GAST|nr:hypothetical protein PoB_000075400 [Plakobranchus ocellatus]